MREGTLSIVPYIVYHTTGRYSQPASQFSQPVQRRDEPSRARLSQVGQVGQVKPKPSKPSDTPSEVSSLLFAIITMCVLPPGPESSASRTCAPRRTGFHELIVDRWPFSVYPTRTKPAVFCCFGQDFAVRSVSFSILCCCFFFATASSSHSV